MNSLKRFKQNFFIYEVKTDFDRKRNIQIQKKFLEINSMTEDNKKIHRRARR